MKRKILLLSLLLCPMIAFGQEKEPFKNKYSVGVGLQAVITTNNDMSFETIGDYKPSLIQPKVFFASQFTKRSGVELGVVYNNKIRTIEVPLSYKFNSDILNFSIGAQVGFPVEGQPYPALDGYWTTDGSTGQQIWIEVNRPAGVTKHYKQSYGFIFKLSKNFKFDKVWNFEPFIVVNPKVFVHDANTQEPLVGQTIPAALIEERINTMDFGVGVSFRLDL